MNDIFEYKNKTIGYYKMFNGVANTKKTDPEGKPITREWVIQIFSIRIGQFANKEGKWAPCFYSGRTVIDPKKPISFSFRHDISKFKNKTTGKDEYKFQLQVIDFTQDTMKKDNNTIATSPVDYTEKNSEDQEKNIEKALEGLI